MCAPKDTEREKFIMYEVVGKRYTEVGACACDVRGPMRVDSALLRNNFRDNGQTNAPSYVILAREIGSNYCIRERTFLTACLLRMGI